MNRRGVDAERRARRHYRLRAYRILAQNAWSAGYELDLVVRRGRQLAFVEVKERGSDAFGAAEEMVSSEKQRRIRRAAEAWLAARPQLGGLDVSFDVVAVQNGRLERLADAF